ARRARAHRLSRRGTRPVGVRGVRVRDPRQPGARGRARRDRGAAGAAISMVVVGGAPASLVLGPHGAHAYVVPLDHSSFAPADEATLANIATRIDGWAA